MHSPAANPAHLIRRFHVVPEIDTLAFGHIVGGMKAVLQALNAGEIPGENYSEAELEELCRSLVIGQRPKLSQTIAGSWCVAPDDGDMPSDARFDFIRVPSLVAVSILALVQQKYPRIANRVSDFRSGLQRGMEFVATAGFEGHGYGSDLGAIDSVNTLLLGRVPTLLEGNLEYCPGLQQRLVEYREHIRNQLNLNRTTGAWGEEYRHALELLVEQLNEGRPAIDPAELQKSLVALLHRVDAEALRRFLIDRINGISGDVASLTRELRTLLSDERIDLDARLTAAAELIDETLSPGKERFKTKVAEWLASPGLLHEVSASLLASGEMLFEIFESRAASDDSSPFVLQYCRALENEILCKLFKSYTETLRDRRPDWQELLSDGLLDSERPENRFAARLNRRDPNYPLGDMVFVMRLLKTGGRSLEGSGLLSDFRDFVTDHFEVRVLEHTFLAQIEVINSDFRRKSAHPNLLDFELATRCREAVRTCLNELLLCYKATSSR